MDSQDIIRKLREIRRDVSQRSEMSLSSEGSYQKR